MKIIKRKILIETLFSRRPDVTYGTMTASTVYLPIFITQTFDNTGLMIDQPFTDSGSTITLTGNTYNTRMPGTTPDMYYDVGDMLSGYCDSRLTECRHYGVPQYIPNVPVDPTTVVDFEGNTVSSFNELFNLNSTLTSGTTTYTIGGNPLDPGYGTIDQRSGIFLIDYGLYTASSKTIFVTKNEGINSGNSSLSANTSIEEYLGIVFPPETQSDVFIIRGRSTIFEPHFKLGEVESVDHLERFGNGYYNVIKDI